MLDYRIELTPDDNDTFLVRCPQLPIVLTFGETEEDARRRAVDAIETALASMIDDGEDIPRPDLERGIRVRLPLLTALKVNLYWALREAGITRAELGRRLGWNRESVDRLFRLDHRSRLEQIEDALAALGRFVAIGVLPINPKPQQMAEIEKAMEEMAVEMGRFELAEDDQPEYVAARKTAQPSSQ